MTELTNMSDQNNIITQQVSMTTVAISKPKSLDEIHNILQQHYTRLMSPVAEGEAMGISKEYDAIDNSSLKLEYSFTTASKRYYRNRYRNILAPDDTLVPLWEEFKLGSELTPSDYINANFVMNRKYILTQGPMRDCFEHFWSMIFNNINLDFLFEDNMKEIGKEEEEEETDEQRLVRFNVHREQDADEPVVCVNLTKEVEDGRIKYDKYFPTNVDEEILYGKYGVKLVSSEDIGKSSRSSGTELPRGSEKVENRVLDFRRSNAADLVKRVFLVRNTLNDNMKPLKVIHFHYTGWPDGEAPENSTDFLEICEQVNAVKTSKPIVVHCSAGIGRTGTFAFIHSTSLLLNKLANGGTLETDITDFPKQILGLRKDRPDLVQTAYQYDFCYRTILEKLNSLLEINSKVI